MLLSQHWACSSTTRSSQRPWRSGCSVPCHRIAWHCSVPSSSYRRCCVASAAATPQPPEGQSDDKTPANAVAPRAAPRRSRSQQPQSNSGASSGGPRSAGTPSSNGNANSSDSSSSSNSSRRHGDAAAGGRSSSSSSNNDKGDNTAVPAGTSSRAVAGRSSGHVSSTGSTQQPRGQKQRRVGAASSQPQLVNDRQLTTLIKEQTNLAGVQGLLKRHRKLVNVIHINATLKWLVDHPQQQPCSSQELAAVVQQLVKGVTLEQPPARNCASIAYYCSKLGYVEDLGLYRALLQRFMVVKAEASPQHISNMLYALGSQEQLQGVLEEQDLVELLQQLQMVGGDATTQAICNALWAAAKCEPGDGLELGEVVVQLLGRFQGALHKATPQAVANTLYALAALPRAWPMDSALQLVERLVQLLPQAQPQHMSNVLWALGRYVEHGWLVALSEQPCARLQAAVAENLSTLAASSQGVKPQEVSNSLWGLALLQAQVDWRVVGQLLGQVTAQQPDAQALATACWAVAKLQQLQGGPSGQQQPWQAPFSAAVDAFAPLLHKADPQAVANMLWACVVVRHYPEQLLDAVMAVPPPLPHVQHANAQNVANLAWALAVLAPDPPPAALVVSLLQRMQGLLAQQASAVNSQELANTAWAVAVLDQQQLAGQLEPLAAAAFSQRRWGSSQPNELPQWHQVHLWLTDTQVLGPAGLGAISGVTQQQLEQCRAAWDKHLGEDAKASQAQREVDKVLSSMPGVQVVGVEQQDQHDGSRSIDIVARYKGMLLAVEVDGATHFTWPGQRPTGLTLARNRALEHRGYRVVCVPCNPGWDQQRGQQQQQQYLRRLLDAAVCTGPASGAGAPRSQDSKPLSNSSNSGSTPQKQGGNALRRLADAARRKQQQQQQHDGKTA